MVIDVDELGDEHNHRQSVSEGESDEGVSNGEAVVIGPGSKPVLAHPPGAIESDGGDNLDNDRAKSVEEPEVDRVTPLGTVECGNVDVVIGLIKVDTKRGSDGGTLEGSNDEEAAG